MIDDSYKVTLHAKDLPLVLNRKYYDDLVENFTIIQDSLNDVLEAVGNKKQMAEFNKKLSQLEARINRISQSGIDQVALEQAVENVLKLKGVI